MTIRDRIRAWLGVDEDRGIIDTHTIKGRWLESRIDALEEDLLALSNQRTITPVNQPEHRPRPLSGAAIRRLSEQINAKTFDEENHG